MTDVNGECQYQHRGWSRPCGRPEDDAIHYEPDGYLRPPYGKYSGPVRHPFNASDKWDVWLGEPREVPA